MRDQAQTNGTENSKEEQPPRETARDLRDSPSPGDVFRPGPVRLSRLRDEQCEGVSEAEREAAVEQNGLERRRKRTCWIRSIKGRGLGCTVIDRCLKKTKRRYLYIYMSIYFYKHTHIYYTSMSISKKLSRLDLEIHKVDHQDRLVIHHLSLKK
jgi:hypothetical protein